MSSILLAGLICGILDATAATVLAGGQFSRVWRFVSRGIGANSVPTGLALHFLIATTAAAVYYALSRRISFLIERPLIAGPIYGALVHIFMTQVTIPLSMLGRRPFSLNAFLTQLAVHMIIVGPSIALTIARTAR